MASRNRKLVLALLAVGFLLLGVLPMCSFQVRITEYAIVETFGEYKLVAEPGFNWKLPWPLQKVHKLDRSLKLMESRYEETYFQDDKNLVITMYVLWKIDRPLHFFSRAGSRLELEQSLRDAVGTEKSIVCAQHPVTHLVSTDPEQRRFARVEQEILARVRERTQDEYGIEIVGLGIQQLMLPPNTTDAVLERMATDRRRRADAIRNSGKSEANRIETAAQQQHDEAVAAAEAKAADIRSDADLKVAELYNEFKGEEGREFAVFLRQLDALEEVLKSETTLIMDRRTPPFDLLQQPPADEPAP